MAKHKKPVGEETDSRTGLTVVQSIHDILANSEVNTSEEIVEACSDFGRRFSIIAISRALAEIGYDAQWEIKELKRIVETASPNQTAAKMKAMERLARYADLLKNQENIGKTPASSVEGSRSMDIKGKAGVGSAKDARQKQHEKRYGKHFMEEVDAIDD